MNIYNKNNFKILKNSYIYVFELNFSIKCFIKISLQHSGFSHFYVTIIVTCNVVQTANPIIIMNWY